MFCTRKLALVRQDQNQSKKAFPLVEVELKRPDGNCSLFQAFVWCSAARRKRARKKQKGGKEGEREGNAYLPRPQPYPTPSLFVCFFFAHISLRCPHDLNAWNRLRNCGKKRLSCFHRISIHNNVIPKYLDNALTDFA